MTEPELNSIEKHVAELNPLTRAVFLITLDENESYKFTTFGKLSDLCFMERVSAALISKTIQTEMKNDVR